MALKRIGVESHVTQNVWKQLKEWPGSDANFSFEKQHMNSEGKTMFVLWVFLGNYSREGLSNF